MLCGLLIKTSFTSKLEHTCKKTADLTTKTFVFFLMLANNILSKI